MDKAKFFAAIKPKFGGALMKDQVVGMEAIIDGFPGDRRWLAYMLATAFHETGGKFIASVEILNYSVAGLLKTFSRSRISEADANRLGRTTSRPADQVGIANAIYGGTWGAANLGNTQPGDGWAFRGRGLVQITGRKNYSKYDLQDTPDRAKDLATAVHVMVDGMVNGRFTGKKLSNYFIDDHADPVNARKIINGLDKAKEIAAHYAAFEHALAVANA